MAGYKKGDKDKRTGRRGRPPKVEEQVIRRFALSAVKDVFGSEENYWKHLAENSKESFPHYRLLSEYLYGKPKERVEMTIGEGDESGIDYSKLSTATLMDLKKNTVKNPDDYDGSDDDLY